MVFLSLTLLTDISLADGKMEVACCLVIPVVCWDIIVLNYTAQQELLHVLLCTFAVGFSMSWGKGTQIIV